MSSHGSQEDDILGIATLHSSRFQHSIFDGAVVWKLGNITFFGSVFQ
jgi:hypothetical protein